MGQADVNAGMRDQVVRMLVRHAGDFLKEKMGAARTLRATRFVLDVLATFGVRAGVAPCTVTVVNKPLRMLLADAKRWPTMEELDAWRAADPTIYALACGPAEEMANQGKGLDEIVEDEPGWPRRLIVMAGPWLIDPGMGFLSRPDKGMPLPELICVPAPQGGHVEGMPVVHGYGPSGEMVEFSARYDPRFIMFAGFQRTPESLALVQEFVEMLAPKAEA